MNWQYGRHTAKIASGGTIILSTDEAYSVIKD